jgi:hypothetical protein
MKRPAFFLSMAILLTACAEVRDSSIEPVHAGMNREQVQSILGVPESAAYAPGKDCAYYTLLKDFWLRTPWSMSRRYYVCYDDGKVESFGRVDQPRSG